MKEGEDCFVRLCHRSSKINSGSPKTVKVRSQVADLEVTCPIPPQNGVVPAAFALTEGDRANRILHGITEPFNLLADGQLQNGMKLQEPFKFRSAYVLNSHRSSLRSLSPPQGNSSGRPSGLLP